jgi:hypothetical protein
LNGNDYQDPIWAPGDASRVRGNRQTGDFTCIF